MNREIKFRAWDKEEKKYIYCGLEYAIENLNKNHKIILESNPIGFTEFDYEYFILEQYTGLKDSEGQEIYEGDIVIPVCDDNDYTIGIIEFDIESGAFVLKNERGLWQRFGVTICNEDLEIIGNIHENPELLVR